MITKVNMPQQRLLLSMYKTIVNYTFRNMMPKAHVNCIKISVETTKLDLIEVVF